jgi:O-antigen/teichoic acid export membrane protein
MRGRLVRNSAWALSSSGVIAFAVFVETIVLARYLEPEELGVLLLAIAYPEAVQKLLDFRVKDATTKYLSEFLEHDRPAHAIALVKLLWVIDIAVGALALMIVLATAGVAAGWFVDDPDASRLMSIYAIGMFFACLDSAAGSVLRVMDRFRLAFAAGTTGIGCRLALVLLVVSLGGGLEALVWARVGGEVLLALIQGTATLAVLRPLLAHRRSAPISLLGDRRREIRSYLFHTNLTGVARMASGKLDTLLVGALATPAIVSFYKLGLQFGRMPALLTDALHVALFPSFARDFAQGRMREMRQIARTSSIVMGAVMLPVLVLGALFGEQLIVALVGEAFRDAATPMLLCLLGITPLVVFFWLPTLLLTVGHAGLLLRTVIAGTIVQLVALVALVPSLDASGAAFGFTLGSFISVGLGLGFVLRHGLLAMDDATAHPVTPVSQSTSS